MRPNKDLFGKFVVNSLFPIGKNPSQLFDDGERVDRLMVENDYLFEEFLIGDAYLWFCRLGSAKLKDALVLIMF